MTLRKNVMLLLTVKLALLEFLRIASTNRNNLRYATYSPGPFPSPGTTALVQEQTPANYSSFLVFSF